jgi:hypothetical protein
MKDYSNISKLGVNMLTTLDMLSIDPNWGFLDIAVNLHILKVQTCAAQSTE